MYSMLVARRIVNPEIKAILKDVRMEILRKQLTGVSAQNFHDFFPAQYCYYQGLLQGLLLAGVIDDKSRDDLWKHFEEYLEDELTDIYSEERA